MKVDADLKFLRLDVLENQPHPLLQPRRNLRDIVIRGGLFKSASSPSEIVEVEQLTRQQSGLLTFRPALRKPSNA